MRTLKEIDNEIDSCIKETQNLDSNSETWIKDFTHLAKTIKRLEEERMLYLIMKRNKYDTMENYIKLLEQKLETMKTKQVTSANNLEKMLDKYLSIIPEPIEQNVQKVIKTLKQK